MNKIIKFSVNDIEELVESDEDIDFVTARIKAFADGDNRHHLFVSEDTLKRTADTIYDKPLVWIYDRFRDDIGGHDKEEIPCGFVHRENNPITYNETNDGRLMLTVNAKIWKRYSKNLLDFFKRDNLKKPVSVEIVVNECVELDNGITELKDFSYLAITILGTNVLPAIPDAECEITKFTCAKNDYYEKYFSANNININNSKESATNKNGAWSNPGRKLYSKLLKANNSKALVDEAYLIVEDGYEDTPSTSLKYPHHSIVNGELVVNVQGLQAAFSRASQQHIVSGKVKAHLLRHYRELGLDMANFTEKEDEVEMATKKDIKEEEEKKNQKMNAETENKEKETKMEANSEDMSCKMEKETFEDDENKKKDTSKEEKENNDDKEDEEKVDYEAKYAEYENKIAEMEENNKAFMKELEELRKYKADKEEAERNFKAASLFDEVMDILPKEKYDALKEESKSVENKDFEAFSNKVKALCFTLAVPNKKIKKENRMAINTEEIKTEKKFW